MADGLSIDVSSYDMETLRQLRAKIDAVLDGPGDGLNDLDSAIESMKAMRAKVAAVGKAAVTKAISALLAKHPEVDSVRWTQYTPYFNDGDACEFGVNDPKVRLVDADARSTEDSEECEDGEYLDAWDLGYYAEQHGEAKPEALMTSLRSLNSLFSESEDAMKATFGDHAQVTVGRDGQAEVEEYDHE